MTEYIILDGCEGSADKDVQQMLLKLDPELFEHVEDYTMYFRDSVLKKYYARVTLMPHLKHGESVIVHSDDTVYLWKRLPLPPPGYEDATKADIS